MEILQKPYDRQEYEKLWQDASHQRPLQGVRILRFQNKSYPLGSNGKSYLQLHSGKLTNIHWFSQASRTLFSSHIHILSMLLNANPDDVSLFLSNSTNDTANLKRIKHPLIMFNKLNS